MSIFLKSIIAAICFILAGFVADIGFASTSVGIACAGLIALGAAFLHYLTYGFKNPSKDYSALDNLP